MGLQRLVLVLNASYEPINVCSARRAVSLVMNGAAVVEEKSSYTIRTPQVSVPIPSVIRLSRYRRVPRPNRSVSRKGILLRDNSTCQYCGRSLPANTLTMDHVIPRSQGGPSAWENMVACCFPCNNRKGNRTPVQAGMALLSRPSRITFHTRHRLMARDDAAWAKYLFN